MMMDDVGIGFSDRVRLKIDSSGKSVNEEIYRYQETSIDGMGWMGSSGSQK